MPTPRVHINPDVFRWARAELNLSYAEIAQRFDKSEDEIRRWESGDAQPTYRQLEKLSYSIFKIPLATFLLPEPPEDLSIDRSFRILPDYFLEQTSSKTRIALKKGLYLQESLAEIFGSNPSENPIHQRFTATIDMDPVALAGLIRDELDITLQLQSHFDNEYAAFNHYRDEIEGRGVFVFQMQLEGDRAFCLHDNQFPIIVTNSSDAITSRIFSLFHELTHIILNTSDIFRSLADPYIRQNATEIFCNKVASEVLIPTDEFLSHPMLQENNYAWNENIISRIAREYSVSREVILRKLLDQGYASEEEYSRFKEQWDQEYQERESSGGTYYRNKISAMGRNYIEAVLENYSKGALSSSQVSDYLDIKLSNLSKLESNLY